MVILVNLLFALLIFFVVKWLAGEAGAPNPVGAIIAIIVAIVVYLANMAIQVL
jgi:hypothetical protein